MALRNQLFRIFFIGMIGLSCSFTSAANSLVTPVLSLLLDDVGCEVQPPFARDEFDCDTLTLSDSPWEFVNQDGVDAKISDGHLIMELTERHLWFNNEQGVFMHRSITGDFKATTALRVFRSSDSSQLPEGAVQLAGLMVRDPSSGSNTENYLFIVVGFDVNDISVETKTTTDSVSTFEGPTWPGGEAELRICRIDSVFYLYKRLPGETGWIVADDPSVPPSWPFVRPDLPETLQLGLNIYTSRSNFDVSAQYDFLSVDPVASEGDCESD